ncbi:hypothetical protein [Altererythrobacter sp. GH1-8]|uniref:hypothetical protein n=1 Tax=Altererythrobacter sp. GH1-8 TaxID=3349333 RepID=UPI00374D155C
MNDRSTISVATGGTPTHRLRVPLFAGRKFEPDDLVRYDGPRNWKFEPLDEEERDDWAKEHNTRSDKEKVLHALTREPGKYGIPDSRKGGQVQVIGTGQEPKTPVHRAMADLYGKAGD